MWTWRATTIVVLLGGLAAGGWLHAQDDGCSALSGADIAETHQLYARYNQGLDFKDPELYRGRGRPAGDGRSRSPKWIETSPAATAISA